MKPNVRLLLALITLSLIALSCQMQEEKETLKTEEKTDTIALVKVETVQKKAIENSLTFTATVEPNTINNITSNTPNRIRKIAVEVGDYVRKGQLLVQMDNANLIQHQTQVETLKKDYQRYQELYEVGGVAKQQLDQLKSQLEVAETLLNTLTENTKLLSPTNGVVTARNFDAGDVAAALPILTVENINPVKLKINASESHYTDIQKGMKASLTVDALKDNIYEGRISRLYPTIDPSTHTFAVEISVPNARRELLSGMFARVTVGLGTTQRLLLKDRAVRKQIGSNQRYVFVVKEGKAHYTIVELGTRIDDQYEIISGVAEGDSVVVEGNVNLLDGTPVRIVQE